MKLGLKMILVMLVVALSSAGLLGVVFGVTSPTIAEQKQQAKMQALSMLLPQAAEDGFTEQQVVIDGDTSVIYQACDKNGNKVGLVFTVTPKGYGGPVETMVGLQMDSTVSAIRVASAAEGMAETPGLGSNVTTDWFRDQFKGLRPDELSLTKEGGKIEAITAATISSNAVTSGVRQGVALYLPYLFEDANGDIEEVEIDTSDTSETSEGEDTSVITKTIATEGYAGEFKVVVSMKDGTITEVAIPRDGFEETAGVGTQCCEPGFLDKFEGLTSAKDVMAVDAVSGATVTSEAVKKAVSQAF
jgi:Na+-translocating ferredoxin:NAD+ oxidoreductase subunit G